MHPSWLGALATAAALLLACSPPALAKPDAKAEAQAPAQTAAQTEKCLGCHDDATLKSEDGKPMAMLADHFKHSAHRKLECVDCHAPAPGAKHPRDALGPVQPRLCQDCHADAFKAVAGSIHGRRASGEKAIKDCTGCHGSLHEVFKGGDPASPLSPVNQIKTCGACHEDMMGDYTRSVHAHALLKSGLTEAAPSCASCHGKHDVRPKTDPASTTHHAKSPETCGSCHSGILRE